MALAEETADRLGEELKRRYDQVGLREKLERKLIQW